MGTLHEDQYTFVIIFLLRGSVHRKRIFRYNQQDATSHNLFISVEFSTCFRRFLRPLLGVKKLYIQRRVH